MELLRRLLLTSLVLGFVAMNLFGCSDSSSSTATIPTNRLYMTTAEDGTLSPTGNAGEYVLTLNKVQSDMLWYTDKPARESGEVTVEWFVQYAWSRAYGQTAPNAVLQFYLQNQTEGTFIMVKEPEYNSGTGTLKFQATMINSTFDDQSESILVFEKPVMTVLNNVSAENEASSFVQYSENASLDTIETQSRYTLSLNDVGPEVLWANNAPSRTSNIGTADSFVEQWKDKFADSPPNASLSGTTDSGELGVYLLTLTDPKHEKEANRITYTATLLGQGGGDLTALNSAVLIIDSSGVEGYPACKVKPGPGPMPCCPSDNPDCSNDPTCLLSFDGYKWWTNYRSQWGSPWKTYWNQGNVWDPQGPYVDGEGLHLRVRQANVVGYQWTASQVVAVSKESTPNQPARFGYGKYLVSAKITKGTFSALDPNVCFGLFTYEFEKTGDSNNPNREIDLAEISRFGFRDGDSCQMHYQTQCQGNAQFTLQDWMQTQNNVHRYSLNDSGAVTLTMEWNAQGTPVTFKQYNGTFNLTTVDQQTPSNHWTTTNAQNKFIPSEDGCQRFMMNLWLIFANPDKGGTYPPPTDGNPWEVIVTRFQYAPKTN